MTYAQLLISFTGFAALVVSALSTAAEAPSAAIVAFDKYVAAAELRLARQHQSPSAFLIEAAPLPQTDARLRRGEFIVEKLAPSEEIPGAMLHHWRGTAFAPGATAASFEQLLRDLPGYPRTFAPQVLQARLLSQQNGHLSASMRVRQKHVLTVVLDTTYDITYAQLDPYHRYSLSRSTQVSEIDSAGAKSERILSSTEEHGFLWRLNTYWTWEERDGGLYLQIESVSLTRSIPHGLAWAVRPFVESVPRESLEFTLRSACNALHTSPPQAMK